MEKQNTIEIDKVLTVGELVAEDFRNAEVFRKFGIDFCCGGNVSVDAVCAKKEINTNDVYNALQAITNQPQNDTPNYSSWELDVLIDYIVKTHHTYVNEALPMLDEFSAKVARVHGESHPEVVEIFYHYGKISEELRMHMQKEEGILFPYIKEMVEAKDNGKLQPFCPFGTISNPISLMEMEHESAGGSMYKINNLSSNYTPPLEACNTYRVLYAKLKEFENDLHQHIHLENNILFPKAIAMELNF